MKLHLLAASLALVAGASQANVLDFGQSGAPMLCSSTSDGLGAATACANFGYFLQSYGDVASVLDVTYSAPRINDGRSLRWWDTNYNDLYGVLWADSSDSDSRARIELKPLNGQGITLTHFDLGAYSQSTLNTTVNVFAIGSTTALYTFTGAVGSGLTHASFDINVSSANGLWIEWQDSAYNVGIDNVTFTVADVAAVPEPSTYALLLAGLAACGTVARRRRR
jgi:hypothetical protein